MSEDVDCANDAIFHCTYQHVVQMLIAKYRWTLLPEGDLVRWLLDTAWLEDSPTTLESIVKQHYTQTLSAACQQAADEDQRERAYPNLSRYLYRAAYNRWPWMAEDVVRRGLLLVYEQIDRCRNPATFLACALYKLLHAAKQERHT